MKIDFRPLHIELRPDGKSAYIVGESFAGRLSHATRVARVDFEAGTGSPSMDIGLPSPNSFRITPDETRIVILHGDSNSCCMASVTDLTAGKKLTAFPTGSRGLRIAQALGAAAATAGSYQSGRSAAAKSGSSSFTYTTYSVKSHGVTRGPLTMRADGKFAYALDAQTDYLTIIDMTSGDRSGNFAAGSGVKELVPLDGGTLAVVADDSVTLFDTQKNDRSGEIKLSGDVRDLVLTPDRKYAVVLGKQKLVVFDTHSGKIVSEVGSMAGPTQVIPLE